MSVRKVMETWAKIFQIPRNRNADKEFIGLLLKVISDFRENLDS